MDDAVLRYQQIRVRGFGTLAAVLRHQSHRVPVREFGAVDPAAPNSIFFVTWVGLVHAGEAGLRLRLRRSLYHLRGFGFIWAVHHCCRNKHH